MPRPLKNPDPSPPRQLRMSDEEYELMALLAEREGLSNRSPYLRWLIRREARKHNLTVARDSER